jgi:predicted hydrocarbon binding protein
MSEPRIGRVLVASLHQAIADVLPTRLEFYENWLNPHGLREGTIGLAPLSAVLSFLRSEGDAYAAVTTRAGEYAGEWTVRSLPAMRRRFIAALPVALRSRAALRAARMLVRDTYPGSRAIVRVKGENASIDLRGSLFCEVRQASALPLCGFYAAAFARVLENFAISATAQMIECRSSMTRRGCAMSVTLGRRREPEIERPEHAA